MSKSSPPDLANFHVYFYPSSGQGDIYAQVNAKDPFESVRQIAKTVSKEEVGWFEVYESDSNLDSEMPIFEIWNSELERESGNPDETKI